MTMWTITCPRCGESNTISGNRVPENCAVNCSSCRAPIGLWGEAIRKAEERFVRALAESEGPRP